MSKFGLRKATVRVVFLLAQKETSIKVHLSAKIDFTIDFQNRFIFITGNVSSFDRILRMIE